MNWLRRLMGWEIIGVQHANWEITKSYGDRIEKFDKICTYTFWVSVKKQKFKLQCEGYNPREHKMYSLMIDKLNELNAEMKKLKQKQINDTQPDN